MRLRIPSSAIKHFCKLAHDAIQEKKTNHSGYILISGHMDGTVKMLAHSIGYDLEASFPGEVEIPGEVMLPENQLRAISTGSSKDWLWLEMAKGRMIVQSGKAEHSIPCLDSRIFPNRTRPSNKDFFEVDSSILVDAISRAMPSISDNKDRMLWTQGAYLVGEGNYLIVLSSDGHRAFECRSPMRAEGEFKIVLPLDACRELVKLETFSHIAITQGVLWLKADSFMMGLSLMSAVGAGIDFNSVRNESNEAFSIPSDTERLTTLFDSVATLFSKSTDGLKCVLSVSDNRLTVSCESKELGHSVDAIGIEYTGEAYSYGVSLRYIREALNQLRTNEVRLSFPKDNRMPLLISSIGEGWSIKTMIMGML